MPQGRHEAPWGARNLYTGGGAGTSLTGPGMKVRFRFIAPARILEHVHVADLRTDYSSLRGIELLRLIPQQL